MSSPPFVPPSSATVDVRALDAGAVHIAAAFFLHPVLPGHETMSAIAFSFLVENRAKNQRVLFDLGIGKDVDKYVPSLAGTLKHMGAEVAVEKDVATQLKEGGVDPSSVNAIIWSHSHFDHTGDPATFPPSTELVFGPGTKQNFFPPYPENPDGIFPESFFKDRKTTELSFDDTALTIGGFRALDYFHDGSFYLLDVPGHVAGHMAALARVTPASFVLLGGDTCHHPAQLRPSPNLARTVPCPGALLAAPISAAHFFADGESTDLAARTRPLLELPPPGAPSVHADRALAEASLARLAAQFDARADVFVVVAHDVSLVGVVELFPASMAGWRERGWKARGTWAFLEEGNPAWRFDVK